MAPEVQARLDPSGLVVITDCDVVPDRGCPPDVVRYLAGLLLRYADVKKVGLGLRIDDLPDHYALKREAVEWESQFWESEISPGVFRAPVDTTFALYRTPAVGRFDAALRTGPPYVVQHLPWYSNSTYPTEEESYYSARAQDSLTNWSRKQLKERLRRELANRRARVATRELAESTSNSLLAPWLNEPPSRPEHAFTPAADATWRAWGAMSPELEFCEFVALLARITRPSVIIETGVGQGYLTRRLAESLDSDQALTCFESDPDLRASLALLPFFSTPRRSLSAAASPTVTDLARADLTILDSAWPERFSEFDTWLAVARLGAMLVVHDASDKHSLETGHRSLHEHIEASGLRGVFTANPRGGFLAIQGSGVHLKQEMAHERERRRFGGGLAGIESSRAYRLIGLRTRLVSSARRALHL